MHAAAQAPSYQNPSRPPLLNTQFHGFVAARMHLRVPASIYVLRCCLKTSLAAVSALLLLLTRLREAVPRLTYGSQQEARRAPRSRARVTRMTRRIRVTACQSCWLRPLRGRGCCSGSGSGAVAVAARTLSGLAVRDVRIRDGVGLLLDVPAISFLAGPREMTQRYADMTVAHLPDNSDVDSIVHQSKGEKCKTA